eukprot:m.46587 g.46587  ORF g.46587 m.46587 type:complete len:364 (+) comp10387_c0_seq4:243-1334(+)
MNSQRSPVVVPAPLCPGDVIAIIAPCSGLAAIFPWMREQGVKRIEELGFKTKLFPTANMVEPSPEDRAKDIHDAFIDADVKGIVCCVGGDDLLRVLPLLDSSIIQSNPTALFGFSDVTTLHMLLWKLRIVSYYGGNLIQQFAVSGSGMQYFTRDSFLHAATTRETVKVTASKWFQDGYLEFADQANLTKEAPRENSNGWIWHDWDSPESCRKQASGRLWGGCLETLAQNLVANCSVPTQEELSCDGGAILFFETSECMPHPSLVYIILSGMGSRGLLSAFSAVLVGRAKTLDRGRKPQEGRQQYKDEQRDAVIRALRDFHKDGPLPIVVFDMDFGHTDPQLLVPSGGVAVVDAEEKEIHFRYN